MGDLVTGVTIVIGVSLACVRIGFSIERRRRKRTANAVALGAVATVFLYGWLLHGRLILARLIPLSNVIVLGNVIPPGAAVLIGILLGRRAIPLWRRVAVATILAALAGYSLLADVVGPCPRAKAPRYDQGVCLQTNLASCSACCAASLLREHGIPASEKEMIPLCVTRLDGTPPLGLYRGLKLKTRGTAWDVEVFRGSLEDLREADTWPVILMVRLLPDCRGQEGYCKKPRRQSGHAVLLCAVTEDGNALVADPAEGVKLRPIETLERVWAGEGLRLTRRPDCPPAAAMDGLQPGRHAALVNLDGPFADPQRFGEKDGDSPKRAALGAAVATQSGPVARPGTRGPRGRPHP